MKTRFFEIALSAGLGMAFLAHELPPRIEKPIHAENVGTASVVYVGSAAASGASGGVVSPSAAIHPILVASAFPVVFSPEMALPQPLVEWVDARGFHAAHAFHESNRNWLAPAPPRPRVRPRQFTDRG